MKTENWNIYLVADYAYVAARSEAEAYEAAKEFGMPEDPIEETSFELAPDHTYYDDAYNPEESKSRSMNDEAIARMSKGRELPFAFAIASHSL